MKATKQAQETRIQQVIDKIKSKYAIPPLAPGEPLRLAVDGLSENRGGGIGIMGAGIHLRQGDRCLVAESMCLGHGSCNEAEYLALLNGLRITRTLYPNLDEMAGQPSDTEGGEMWQADQIEPLREELGLTPFAEPSGDGCLCEKQA